MASSSSSLAITAAPGKTGGDLGGEVGAGEDGGAVPGQEGRQPSARAGVEPLGQAEHRRALREIRGYLSERVAGDGHDEEVGVRDLGQRDRSDVADVHIRQVALVAAGLGDRPRLFGIANRERDFVPAVGEEARERRPPRAAADDGGSHLRRTKSISTGTPSRSKRSRSRFSTQ